MIDRLAMKLEAGCALTDDDRAALAPLSGRTRSIAARANLISEGGAANDVLLITAGFACRYKVVQSGARQIVGLLLPGDLSDTDPAAFAEADHGIATITRCSVAEVSRLAVGEVTSHNPRIARALRWSSLVDQAIAREWLTSMGRRAADQHLAHLLCEVHLRLQIVGLADDRGCQMPLTQSDLADCLGLSIVHVNRSVQKLRGLGLISLKSDRLEIQDRGELEEFAGFNPSYLHLRSGWENLAAHQQRGITPQLQIRRVVAPLGANRELSSPT